MGRSFQLASMAWGAISTSPCIHSPVDVGSCCGTSAVLIFNWAKGLCIQARRTAPKVQSVGRGKHKSAECAS